MLPVPLLTPGACRTPGTGKTTHATQLLEALQTATVSCSDVTWEHVNVGDFVKEKGCHSGWNEEWQSWDVDEDKVRFFSSSIPARGTPSELTSTTWRAAAR